MGGGGKGGGGAVLSSAESYDTLEANRPLRA